MLFAGRTFSADALRGLRRPSHKTQYDSETVTLSNIFLWLCTVAQSIIIYKSTSDTMFHPKFSVRGHLCPQISVVDMDEAYGKVKQLLPENHSIYFIIMILWYNLDKKRGGNYQKLFLVHILTYLIFYTLAIDHLDNFIKIELKVSITWWHYSW